MNKATQLRKPPLVLFILTQSSALRNKHSSLSTALLWKTTVSIVTGEECFSYLGSNPPHALLFSLPQKACSLRGHQNQDFSLSKGSYWNTLSSLGSSSLLKRTKYKDHIWNWRAEESLLINLQLPANLPGLPQCKESGETATLALRNAVSTGWAFFKRATNFSQTIFSS